MTPTLSTPALVLHTTQYAETSIIAKLFTRQLGVRSYIIKGVRKSGSRAKQNLFQPLSYLDMVVYDNPKSNLNYIKEAALHRGAVTGHTLQDVAVANALRFFMTELLYKALPEAEPMPELFDEVTRELDTIDESGTAVSHRPILFLLCLSRHLGIAPLDNYSLREPLFNLEAGRFQFAAGGTLERADSLLLHHYLLAVHNDGQPPVTTLGQRTRLIDSLVEYYQLHLAGFSHFSSHEILHSILQ